MELFGKIVTGWKPLTISAKRSILDIWQGSEYASAILLKEDKRSTNHAKLEQKLRQLWWQW